MNEKLLLKKIRQELSSNIDKKYKKNSEKFFKEKIKTYGVRTPIVRRIAKKYFKEIRDWEKEKTLKLIDSLFKSGYNQEFTIGTQWLGEIKNNLNEKDFILLKKFVDYIDNWGKCDDFCLRVLSHFIARNPKFKQEVKTWTQSRNRWKRRSSAVSFIKGGNIWKIQSNYLKDVFQIAEKLMKDEDDLVQKGYGWMLKVAAENHRKEVFDFVIKNKQEMSRTALRYAIEKMPKELRNEAMKK